MCWNCGFRVRLYCRMRLRTCGWRPTLRTQVQQAPGGCQSSDPVPWAGGYTQLQYTIQKRAGDVRMHSLPRRHQRPLSEDRHCRSVALPALDWGKCAFLNKADGLRTSTCCARSDQCSPALRAQFIACKPCGGRWPGSTEPIAVSIYMGRLMGGDGHTIPLLRLNLRSPSGSCVADRGQTHVLT
jgi:hypothetical protein